MKSRFGKEFEDFIAALEKPPVLSVRKNPLKITNAFSGENDVPWMEGAKYLETRPPFVLDPLHHAGAYYVQEASSMLFAKAVEWDKDQLIFDLCAAPGGKSTLMLSLMNDNSFLISNELVKDRAMILRENINRWGSANVAVTRNNMQELLAFKGMADMVLVDAPCSGEGMFRKDKGAVEQWGEGLVYKCARDQKDILSVAYELLKEDGLLIFSTCTYEPEENQENIEWLYSRFDEGLEPAKLNIHPSWGVEVNTIATPVGEQEWYACLPHKIRGEGLFISAFRKKGGTCASGVKLKGGSRLFRELSAEENKEVMKYIDVPGNLTLVAKGEEVMAIPSAYAALIEYMHARARVLKAGTSAGVFKGKKLIPSHELAMSTILSGKVPRVEVNLDKALKYLKKEPFEQEIPFLGWGGSKL